MNEAISIPNQPTKRKAAFHKKEEFSLSKKAKTYFSEYANESNESKRFYKCNLCGEVRNGTKLFNLASHLSYAHIEIFNQLRSKEKDPIFVKRLQLLHNAVEIVSVNGLPFNFLLSSGYQSGIQNKVRKIREAGYSIDITTTHMTDVKEHLHSMAEKVRSRIRQEVKNRNLSALIDIVTVNSRSILGLSLQFMIDGQLKVRSIG